MTYFNGQTNADQTAEPTPTSNQEDFVAQVVASKGDQWSNPQELAKGYIASQQYIKNLENQAKEMQEAIGKEDYAKTLLEQLQAQGKPTTGEQPAVNSSTEQEHTAPDLSEDKLKNLMKEVLNQTTTENVKNSNLRNVDEKLKELYGTEAEATMAKRSEDLGLSKEKLAEIAGESPDAFFRLIGETVKKEDNKMTKGTLNTTAESFTNTSSERNWAYYETLRKTNKKLYFSPKVQQQLFEDKMAQGSSFGNT